MNNRLGFEDNLHWDILANFCVGEQERVEFNSKCYLSQQTVFSVLYVPKIVGLTLCVS